MNHKTDSQHVEAPAGPAEGSQGKTPCSSSTAAALRLFASVFQREVDGPLLRQLVARKQDLSDILGGDPLAELDLNDTDKAMKVLAVEYCGLFIGPRGHLPPTESVVRGEGQFWGPSTLAVAEFYRSVGIQVAEDEKTLPDHISMELDCLATLLETDRHADAARFAGGHLVQWMGELTEHVNRRASIPFYLVWAKALAAFLAELFPVPPGTWGRNDPMTASFRQD